MISQYQKKKEPDAGSRLFDPITPLPAYRRVSSAIEQKILARALRPGDVLPTETELARQFAVNRSTVREAFRQLESSGLVGRVTGTKKMVVTRPAQKDTATQVSRALALDEVTFVELWEAMTAIAPGTAALAAANATEAALASLRGAAKALDAARTTNATVTAVGVYFEALAALSGNRVLMLAMQPVVGLLAPSLRYMLERVPRGKERIGVAQRNIIQALEAGNATEAEAWMTRHVEDFRRGYELAGIALDTRVVAGKTGPGG
jgi:GntR family transcriptional repressor for pyruvate dehydrogenase complex